VLIEIGSYAGESAEIFARSKKFSTIVCIDPWQSDPTGDGKNSYKNMDIAEHMFDDVCSKNNIIKKHKGTIDTFIKSDLFKELVGKIDMVYIDGLHTYEGCKHDI
jgi:predicted O-methyltransferase YrrM